MRGAEPAYATIANDVRQEIARGTYRDGRALPTEAEFAKRYRVGRQTVRRAFQELVAEDVVFRVPGRGTFVNESTDGYTRQLGSIVDLMNLSNDTSIEVVSGVRRRANVEAASRLRMTHDVVYQGTIRRLHDGVPFVVTDVYLPESVGRLVAGLPELETGATGHYTVIGLLEPYLHRQVLQAEQSITVALAGPFLADLLGCADGHPLLKVDRLFFDSAGEVTELTVSHFLPEHYTYRVTLKRTVDDTPAGFTARRPTAMS